MFYNEELCPPTVTNPELKMQFKNSSQRQLLKTSACNLLFVNNTEYQYI